MKNSKKSLVLSIVTLLLCSCMSIGLTFAWFTDTVSNTGNKIQAGTLDIDLLQRYDTMSAAQKEKAGTHADKEFVSLDTEDLSTIGVFDYDKWEPGYTAFKVLKIANNGSLALKFNLQFIAKGEVKTPARLADVIDVYTKLHAGTTTPVTDPTTFDEAALLNAGFAKTTLSELIDDLDGAAHGYMIPSGELTGSPSAYDCYIVMHMREDAGNDYQDQTVGDTLDIKLNATQYTFEKDGFGSDQYDVEAKNPTYYVDSSELSEAISEAKEGDTIYISKDSSNIELPATLNANGITLKGEGNDTKLKTNKLSLKANDVTISDMTINGSGASGTDGDLNITGNNATMKNVNFVGGSKATIAIAVSTNGTEGIDFDNVTITNSFRGIQFWKLSGKNTIKNSVLDIPGYTFNVDAIAPGATLEVENTTLKGWTSYTDGIALVSFKNCSFGKNQYEYLRPYSNTLLENCSFSADYLFSAGGTAAFTWTINNCTVNGVKLTASNFNDYKDNDGWNSSAIIIIDGVTVE